MKKSVLLLAAVLMAGNAFAFTNVHRGTNATLGFQQGPKAEKVMKAPAREEAAGDDTEEVAEEMEFGYASDPYTAFYTGQESAGNAIYVAFKIPASETTALAGNKISAIKIYTGTTSSYTNSLKTVYPFITTDLSASEYEYSGTLKCGSAAFTQKTHTLSEPYTIEAGKDLYVGYFFEYTTALASQYYLVVDYVPTSEDIESCLVGIAETAATRPSSFSNNSTEIGSTCISVTLTGDNLPQDQVEVTSTTMAPYSKPNQDFTYDMSIKNRGANTIKNLTVETVAGSKTTSYDITLDEPLKSGERADIEVVANCSETGLITAVGTLTKVNGNENLSTKNSGEGIVGVYDTGYTRKVVVEEATGLWCGYCPAGMVMLEYMKNNYPDKFALIGVHSDGGYSTPEPMQVQLYQNFISDFVSGFPAIVINRYFSDSPSGMTEDEQHEYIKEMAEYYTYPAYVNVELSGSVNEENMKVDVTANTTFAFDTNVKHYVSFVVVEDNVGPYVQSNYYAGGKYGTMGGWESKKSSVSTMFNDVARNISSYPGHANSIPSTIVAGEEYSYTKSVSIKNVVGTEFRVIALVTNAETGEIVNAAEVPFQWASVDNVIADEAVNAANAETVYTLDGRRVSKDGLESGLYIMVKGGKASKVLVK